LTLYSGSSDGDIRLWSISKDSGKCQAVMKSNSGTIENLQLSYDNATLFSCGSGDLSIKQWDLETLQVINTFEGHLTTVYKILVDEDVMWSGN
jgi:WD40 repeat protein